MPLALTQGRVQGKGGSLLLAYLAGRAGFSLGTEDDVPAKTRHFSDLGKGFTEGEHALGTAGGTPVLLQR
jgi:hypothetical protein